MTRTTSCSRKLANTLKPALDLIIVRWMNFAIPRQQQKTCSDCAERMEGGGGGSLSAYPQRWQWTPMQKIATFMVYLQLTMHWWRLMKSMTGYEQIQHIMLWWCTRSMQTQSPCASCWNNGVYDQNLYLECSFSSPESFFSQSTKWINHACNALAIFSPRQ